MERKSKTVVLGIIENEKGEILLTERFDPKIKAAHKKRDVPGGTQEIGETIEETVLREIEEEVGIKANILSGIFENYSKSWEHEDYIQDIFLHCFICKIESGTPQVNDPKIGKIQRMNIEEALILDLLETTMFFLKIYADMKK